MVAKPLATNHALGKWLLLLTLTLIYWPDLATAQRSSDVKWGGLWLRGSNSDRDEYYPVGSKFAFNPHVVLTEEDSKRSAALGNKLKDMMRAEAKPAGGRIVDRLMPDDELANPSSGRALVMACAINYEFFETTVEAGISVVYVEIGFDLLMCNFSDRSVVFSLPARLQFKDLAEDKGQEKLALRQIYSERLPKKFLELSKTPWDGGLAFKTVGFGKINVWDKAKERMPEEFASRPEFLISQLFASTFSKSVQLPITPYSLKGGEAVYHGFVNRSLTGKVTAKSASETSFTLGKPDYVVDLTVPTFHESRGAGDFQGHSLHYAFARVTLRSAASKELYNKKFDAGVSRKIPNGGKVRPLWLASWDASNKLFKKAAQEITSSESEDLTSMVQECKLSR